MARQRLDNCGAEPTIATTRWPGPLRDDHWRARTELRGGAMAAAWGEFIGCVPWTKLWTLTFDPKRRFPVGQERASREAFSWVNQAARVQRQPIAWVYATERGASGLWHVHALTTGTIDKVDEYMMLDWQLRNGHAHAATVTDSVGAVLYASKSAAMRGEIVCSDTLVKYRDQLNNAPVVKLYPVGSLISV